VLYAAGVTSPGRAASSLRGIFDQSPGKRIDPGQFSGNSTAE